MNREATRQSVPSYDLSNAADRLRLALDQPSRWRRIAVCNMVARKYGNEARGELVAALQQIAKERAA